MLIPLGEAAAERRRDVGFRESAPLPPANKKADAVRRKGVQPHRLTLQQVSQETGVPFE